MAKSIRDAYGEALLACGRENPNIVVLDADVSGSTRSAYFAKEFPERFFNVGIAEANMTAMAAGFAMAGKVPYVNTFAAFVTTLGLLPARALCSYSNIPVKLMGAYGGLSDSFDGPSHHAVEDLAIMRSLPNFKVKVASDARLTDWLVRSAVDDPSPMYIRLSRDTFPDVYTENDVFEDGKGRVVREGGDATVIACGITVGFAVQAAEDLAKQGISVRVVDMYCLKPIDSELVVDCAKKTGAIVTAEEHSIIGGLGGAVCETLCEAGAAARVKRVGLSDCHAECGPYDKLLDKYGLNKRAIVSAIKEIIAKN
jgi:transketolase